MTRPPSRARLVDAIRRGVVDVKGAEVASAEITEDTCFWWPTGPEDHCLDFDSLDLLDLVLFVEEDLGWRVPDDEIDAQGWRTVGDLVDMLLCMPVEATASQNS